MMLYNLFLLPELLQQILLGSTFAMSGGQAMQGKQTEAVDKHQWKIASIVLHYT